MESTDFGATLRKIRKSKRFTQNLISERIGVAISTYRNWESGVNIPRRSFIPRIAKALEVNPNVLMKAANIPYTVSQHTVDYQKATELASQLIGLFAGGELTEKDKDVVMFTLQQAYISDKQIRFPDDDADIWNVNEDGV